METLKEDSQFFWPKESTDRVSTTTAIGKCKGSTGKLERGNPTFCYKLHPNLWRMMHSWDKLQLKMDLKVLPKKQSFQFESNQIMAF